MFDDKVRPTAVYGGKPLYRVSVDGWDSRANAATANIPTFTEYRIEVAHTSDGTLPVTEQTDGIDVNRMPDAPPTVGSATNTATDSPFVELVMGTVVGNDPLGGRDQYGVPLKAEVYRDGVFSPKITALGGPEASINDQLAFMIRVKNPSDPKAPPAFWGITKGGALKSYFPGKGSETTQEHYQTGKKLHLGTSETGDSFVVEAEGCAPSSTSPWVDRPTTSVRKWWPSRRRSTSMEAVHSSTPHLPERPTRTDRCPPSTSSRVLTPSSRLRTGTPSFVLRTSASTTQPRSDRPPRPKCPSTPGIPWA